MCGSDETRSNSRKLIKFSTLFHYHLFAVLNTDIELLLERIGVKETLINYSEIIRLAFIMTELDCIHVSALSPSSRNVV